MGVVPLPDLCERLGGRSCLAANSVQGLDSYLRRLHKIVREKLERYIDVDDSGVSFVNDGNGLVLQISIGRVLQTMKRRSKARYFQSIATTSSCAAVRNTTRNEHGTESATLEAATKSKVSDSENAPKGCSMTKRPVSARAITIVVHLGNWSNWQRNDFEIVSIDWGMIPDKDDYMYWYCRSPFGATLVQEEVCDTTSRRRKLLTRRSEEFIAWASQASPVV